MLSFKTHLTELQSTARRCPSAPAFRLPNKTENGFVNDWSTITYYQFLLDVEVASKYWSIVLNADGIPLRSVVGMWYVVLLVIKSPFSWRLGLLV